MRNKPYTLKNKIKVLLKELTISEQKKLDFLIKQNVIVKYNNKKITPEKIEDAVFCSKCAANNFIIPGLEFDNKGLCPMCQNEDVIANFKSVLPVKNVFKTAKKSRFDVALFYTGGKDSSYLLYYLSKVCKLRVLALTWEIPFMSVSARKSIEAAKFFLPNVEFVSRKMSDSDLRKIYTKLYDLAGNTCACPSLAYILFYPIMVSERVPYFVAGNEPVQMINLYFNHMVPKLAYSAKTQKMLLIFYNIMRFVTLRPMLKTGQMHTIFTMKQLAYGDSFFKKMSPYEQEIIKNIMISIRQIKHLVKPLRKSIRYSSFTGRVPAFVQVDFNDIANGDYDWRKVKKTIKDEIGWVGPDDETKGLHTSCEIEKCKDYSQFVSFYYMKKTMIPFSAIEVSLASKGKNLSKEMAIKEIKTHLGFSLESLPECQKMSDYLNK